MSDLSQSGARRSEREVELEDRLADVLAGFVWWRDQKVSACEGTTTDEMFIRWVEHNERETF